MYEPIKRDIYISKDTVIHREDQVYSIGNTAVREYVRIFLVEGETFYKIVIEYDVSRRKKEFILNIGDFNDLKVIYNTWKQGLLESNFSQLNSTLDEFLNIPT